MFRFRSVIACLALALLFTLLSAMVHPRVTMTYSDIMGCEQGCDVVGAGFPVAFIADYPGFSPVNSADVMGALLGMDRLLWTRAVVVFAFWTAVSAFIVWGVARARDTVAT